jgi:uncharacterized membrane protein
MGPDRLKGFTDGVLAIVITIMVLELRVPDDAELTSLHPLVPVALSYLLSFVYLIIYWNNHHHLLNVTRRVTGGILWANAHLLFWLSLECHSLQRGWARIISRQTRWLSTARSCS